MSQMIQCDACKRTMYADSRSEKGDYHEIWVDHSDHIHLCRKCYDLFMKSILHMEWNEYEQQYTEVR